MAASAASGVAARPRFVRESAAPRYTPPAPPTPYEGWLVEIRSRLPPRPLCCGHSRKLDAIEIRCAFRTQFGWLKRRTR